MEIRRLPIALSLSVLAILALLWLLSVSADVALAQTGTGVIRVATTGSDTPGCGSSAIPCATIQYAVDQAGMGDEIRVATGVYTGVNSYGGLSQLVYVSKTVTVRGGYATTNWSTPYPITQPTTLDAQRQGRVIVIAGDISPTIEGLRITGGDATGLDDGGGGMFVLLATAAIKDNQVFSNTADYGGGVCLESSDATFSGNVVAANTATAGGGLYLGSSEATLSENTISGNTASDGGGVFVLDSNDTLISNTVANNIAIDGGGGMFVALATVAIRDNQVYSNTADYGGGLYLESSDATFSGNVVATNTAVLGGGLYLESSEATLNGNVVAANTAVLGGGLRLDFSEATLSENTINGNTASDGGGVFVLDSNYTLISNTVVSNAASNDGGGMFTFSATATIRDNQVFSNTADDGGGLYLEFSDITFSGNVVAANSAFVGGGLHLYLSDATLNENTISGNTAFGYGGGVFVWSGNSTLINNTVAANSALLGGGLYLENSDNATLTGNVVTSNTALVDGGGLFLASDGSRLDDNIVAANTAGNYGGGLYLLGTYATLMNNWVTDNWADNLQGNGLYIDGSAHRLLHTTVARNGGDGIRVANNSTVALTNTILVSHEVGISVDSGSTATLEATLWGAAAWANDLDYWSDASTIITGTHNYWSDPGFVDPANGDYHIGAGSVAVDAGVAGGVMTDIDGDPRPAAFGSDIGADERPGASLRLHKDAWPLVLDPGQVVTYSLVVTNVGALTANGARLTDTLPVHQRAMAVTASQGSCTAGGLWGGGATCNLGMMPPGNTARITLTAQVTTTAPPPTQLPVSMRNTAWVTSTDTTSQTAYFDTTLLYCRARLNDSPTEYDTVQAAVDASTQPADVVKIAGYCTDVSFREGVAQIVYLSKTLTLQGGWDISFTQQSVTSHPTTLDAQGQGRALYITGDVSPTVEGLRITGGDATGLGGGGGGDDAGGGVYVLSAAAIIRDSQVFGNVADDGGGLYLSSSATALSGNVISTNIARSNGGGLYLSGGIATLGDNTIVANSADYGGGLYLYADDAMLDGNTVASNTADYGGGLYLFSSSAALNDNTIISNYTDQSGGGLYLYGGDAALNNNVLSTNTARQGGGLYLRGSTASLIGNVIASNGTVGSGGGLYLDGDNAMLSGNTVISNTASSGGGLRVVRGTATLASNTVATNTANYGGGLYLSSDDTTLNGNNISSNAAAYNGGGLYLSSSDATLNGNMVISNSANSAGGGLYVSYSNATLDGNTVSANAADLGGGLHLYNSDAPLLTNNLVVDNRADSLGSGLYVVQSSPRMLHTTIARNSGGDGSGVYVTSNGSNYSTVALTNTMLVSHVVGITVTAGNTATLGATLWGSGTWANERDWGGDGLIITNGVNIWDDPAFVSPAGSDYHIGAGSAAVDAGVNAGVLADVDGDPRPAAFGYDVGADERPGASLHLHESVWPLVLDLGQKVTYTTVITSVGAYAATDVQLTDTLPPLQRALAVATTQGSCTASAEWGGQVTCNLDVMAPGATIVVTLTAQMTTTAPLPNQLPLVMRNTVWITAAEAVNTTYADTTLLYCRARLNDNPITYTTVQAAVDASAQPADVVKVVGYCTDVSFREGVTQTVYLSKTLTIQGGWNASFTQRNVVSYPTTLDAQGAGRVLYITGDISPTVEGLQVTGGDTAGLGNSPWGTNVDTGGGIYVNAATATIQDNQVFNNTADHGGGVALYLSASVLNGNMIAANTAVAGNGGGLNLRDSDATLNGNIVTANTASGGGGLILYSSAATLNGNTVSTNTASSSGGGLNLSSSAATLDGNTIAANTADYGGGLYLSSSAATINANTVAANTANSGGGLYLGSGTPSLDGNKIVSNTANSGGGLRLFYSNATLSDNIVSANTASSNGGGLSLYRSDATLTNNVVADNQTNSVGDGLYIQGSALQSLHTTIARNSGGDGRGIYVNNSGSYYSSVALTNTILVSQTVGVYVTAGNAATLEATLWGSGAWANGADWDGAGTVATGAVNLWGDPAFVDPDVGDYHISPGSAAVDAGVDAGVDHDMDGDDRPFDGDRNGADGFDIGADELAPRLDVTKHANPDPVQAGMSLTYTLRVTNTGALTLTATVTDVLPENVTPGGVLSWTPGVIALGGVWTQQVVVAVEPGYSGLLANVVQVTTEEGATGIYTETSTSWVPQPDLVVTKQANPDPVQAGSSLTYTIHVTNTGNVALTATVTDVLPDHVTPGGVLSWTPGVIVPDSVWTQQVVVAVEPGYSGLLANVVQVTTEEGAAGVYTETSTSFALQPGLVVTKQANPDPVQAGSSLTYTIHVTNTGNVALTATITDVLPDHVTPGGVLSWTPGVIAPGSVWTQQVVVAVESGYSGLLANVVWVTTEEGAAGVYTETSTAVFVPSNQAPYLPSNPNPANGATNVPITQTLGWQGGDPDGDQVTCTVAFGTNDPPPIVALDVTQSSYDPGALVSGTIYYWGITATDGISTVVGPTWTFSTIGDVPIAPYFTLGVQPAVRGLIQGEHAVYTITLDAYEGFVEPVDLSVSGLPAGASAAFGDDPLTPPVSTPLTITTATSTPEGDYALQVWAAGGSATRTQTVILAIQPQPSGPTPVVTDISPDHAENDQSTDVIISGSDFVATPQVYLGETALLNVIHVSVATLQATVPSNVDAGAFDLTVVNPGGMSGTLPDAFTVLQPAEPDVALVLPVQGFNDVPVVLNIWGYGFATGVTATLSSPTTTIAWGDLQRVSTGHLRGSVPAGSLPGVYNLVVTNPGGGSDTLNDAYAVLDASMPLDDLYATSQDVWVYTPTLRSGQTTELGLRVHRQGGKQPVTTTVRLYVGPPDSGTFIDETETPLIAARSSESTSAVPWTPGAAGSYDVYAVIDPDNLVIELPAFAEHNNVISRTLTVFPPAADTVPPRMEALTINGGAEQTSAVEVWLDAVALELDLPGQSGVNVVRYEEFEFSQGARDWVLIQHSGWLGYASSHSNYAWAMIDSPGVHYIRAWAADADGNISVSPAMDLINYVPPTEYVVAGGVNLYRRYLDEGDQLIVRVTPVGGDPDLYVWPPDWRDGAWSSINSGTTEDVVSFAAPESGTYQIEVYGYTAAEYRLEITVNPAAALAARQVETAPRVMSSKIERGVPIVDPQDAPSNQMAVPGAPEPLTGRTYWVYLPVVLKNR